MTRNQLPEGVGKKIVEALKRQAEADITPLSETKNAVSNSIPLNDIDSLPDINLDDNTGADDIFNDNTIIEETPESVLPLGAIKQKENKIIPGFDDDFEDDDSSLDSIIPNKFEIPSNDTQAEEQTNTQSLMQTPVSEQAIQPQIPQQTQPAVQTPPEFNQSSAQTSPIMPQSTPQINIPVQPTVPQSQTIIPPQPSLFQPNIQQSVNAEAMQRTIVNPEVKTNVSIPANVAVLKNLIATLPVGVTKQTGAQIIRQTLEAMGIPMNGVLKEAQEVQEELNSSTRECMLRIQEYKTNILQLEQSVQEYQKNINQINDLVSLFLLTDRK